MWGANILVFKDGIGRIDPWVFNAVRLVLATLTLSILAALEAKIYPMPAINTSERPANYYQRVLAFSFLSGFLYLITFVRAIDLTTAGNTALILASMPMWTAILSMVFLRERLPQITWIGLLVTFIGTVIVTTRSSGAVSLSSQFFVGNLLMLLASLAWAAATVMSKPLLNWISPLRLAAVSAALTTPLHIALVATQLPSAIPEILQPATLAGIVYSGVCSTGIAYALWHAGVRAVGGSHAAVYQNVVTLVAVIGGWVVLRETPMFAQVLGGCLTICGLLLMRRGRR